MTQTKLNNIAREIIKKNIYLTLGTTDGKTPWTATLYYAVNGKYEFYCISKMNSLHVKHFLKNPKISFSIFDSHQKEGNGNGVQGSGTAIKLSDDEIDEASKWYKTTYIEIKKESFTGNGPYRFFKIIPDHFYVLDPAEKTDVRIEVFL